MLGRGWAGYFIILETTCSSVNNYLSRVQTKPVIIALIAVITGLTVKLSDLDVISVWSRQSFKFFYSLTHFLFQCLQFLPKNDLHVCLQQNKARKMWQKKLSFYIAKVWGGWWYSSHENPAFLNIFSNPLAIFVKMRTPEETHFR